MPLALPCDVIFAPCISKTNVFLSNLPSLINALTELSANVVCTATAWSVNCLYVKCGDVRRAVTACTCGNHDRLIDVALRTGYVTDEVVTTNALTALKEMFAGNWHMAPAEVEDGECSSYGIDTESEDTPVAGQA